MSRLFPTTNCRGAFAIRSLVSRNSRRDQIVHGHLGRIVGPQEKFGRNDKEPTGAENVNITFDYNWPPGNECVRVFFGIPNVNDKDSLFRVGRVKKESHTKVYWQGNSEWLTREQLIKVTFDAERGDQIIVEKQNAATGESESRYRWNTEEEWPPEAQGGSMTSVPYCF
jgi:hypothetical protein